MEPKEPNSPLSDPAERDRPTVDLPTPSAPAALAARYDLLGELGRGGMGIVYKARDRETGAVVALKVLKAEIAARPDLIERFKTELLLARKITHKNVCRVYDLNRLGDAVAISMEFVEGESLRSALARVGGISLRWGLEWASQICAGLGEAHAQGVVHRDLKPENILIARDGTVKVMDFGIARSLEAEGTLSGGVLGTPAYMSPEQAEGKPADARSDIYSLGLVLYEMFTGRPAFKADTPVAFAHKQIHDTPPPPREVEPDLPARIDRAIEKCLEKDPKKRFQSVAELETALSARAEVKAVAAAREEVQLPTHLTRWQRSDWLLVVAAIVGLALFVSFVEGTNFASRTKVAFDHSILRRIAQDDAQKLGAPVGNQSQIVLQATGFLQYDFRAQWDGERTAPRRALELANNPVAYWIWQVNWENGTEVEVNNRGSLMSFNRWFPDTTLIGRLPMEEARLLAEKRLQEFFNRDATGMQLETAGDMWRGRPVTSFTWKEAPNGQGTERTYIVRLAGNQVANLYSGWSAQFPGHRWSDNGRQVLPAVVFALVMVLFGLTQKRPGDLGARWRRWAIAVAFLYGGFAGQVLLPLIPSRTGALVTSAVLGIACAVVLFFASIAMERSVCKNASSRLSTWDRLFRGGLASEPCGLAILRGALVGLALLGADTFLVWAGTHWLGMRLDVVRHLSRIQAALLAMPFPSGGILLDSLFHCVVVAAPVAYLASFIARLVRRSWAVVPLAAATAALILPGPLISLGAVQPYHWKLALLSFDCLALVWTFTRFDTLTVGWTVFTFAFCWQNHILLVMFEPAGNLEQWIAFAVFGLLVLAAAAVAFKIPLRAAYQRLAASFE